MDLRNFGPVNRYAVLAADLRTLAIAGASDKMRMLRPQAHHND